MSPSHSSHKKDRASRSPSPVKADPGAIRRSPSPPKGKPSVNRSPSPTSTKTKITNNNKSNNHDNKKKRRRRKKNKSSSAKDEITKIEPEENEQQDDDETDGIEIEYVAAPLVMDEMDPNFAEFQAIFQKFQTNSNDGDMNDDIDMVDTRKKGREDLDDEEDLDAFDGNDDQINGDSSDQAVSKRKLKKMSRLTVAELKQLVKKPEVVEWVDVTSADPKLLVYLKSYRNSVPVPAHWSQKRKFLQGKRGIEKAAFNLPAFIKATGIMEMREALKEKEETQKLKSKARERMNPKMGKLTVDYQKLHDAFFRWQTKPKLTAIGDLYFEGKEYETKAKTYRPGELSSELREALSIPPLAPPPWLINMQRFGPPPSYPNLKVPGLSAPIPAGAQWGYHPGGWGKPPTDEWGRPLYGDVFGVQFGNEYGLDDEVIDRKLWGVIEEAGDEEEEEEEEEEEMEEEEEDDVSKSGLETPSIASGLVTPSGMASVPSGLETPDYIELRKDARKPSQAQPITSIQQIEEEEQAPKQLFTVLEEKKSTIQGFMGSQHVYDLSASASAAASSASRKRKAPPGSSDIAVALNPEDLESGITSSVLASKYDQQVQLQKDNQEDFSDLVAQQANKASSAAASKKRKKDKGKEKEFKF